ncbi:hypothetical protein QIS99_28800 [Streptomyces sp. B-S-A8]|uniref:SpcZ n=1 Tax=Streptomyces solicavernae TaxID=3043614 RepID=A0ABT6S0F4_9ACTN|nr:hypothetical protein [Streptomyces sp. B-S-A8]MDI3390160.1 hypothetical protein [Streptomyces sp. B-S-A8]
MNPTLTPSAWPQSLSASINGLRESAERARTAYQGADAAAETLRADAAAAEKSAEGPLAATVVYDGYIRRQYATVLNEIAFSHAGTALSLSRVWHRAAYAYAYGVASTFADLQQHRRPELAYVAYDQAAPAPSKSAPEDLRSAYRSACDAHLRIDRGAQPYGREPWATSAEQWHLYAELVGCQVLAELGAQAVKQ